MNAVFRHGRYLSGLVHPNNWHSSLHSDELFILDCTGPRSFPRWSHYVSPILIKTSHGTCYPASRWGDGQRLRRPRYHQHRVTTFGGYVRDNDSRLGLGL